MLGIRFFKMAALFSMAFASIENVAASTSASSASSSSRFSSLSTSFSSTGSSLSTSSSSAVSRSYSTSSYGYGNDIQSSVCPYSSSASSAASRPKSPLTCTVTQQSGWTDGYNLDVKVTNAGVTTTNDWSVVLDFADNETLESAWSAAKLTEGKSVTFGSLSWNGKLASNASTSFGATVRFKGNKPALPTCRVADGNVNRAPFAGEVSTKIVGTTVQVKSLGASDPEGDKLYYSIDFGDGQKIQYPEAWHTYESPGNYTVTVTVSDGQAEVTSTKEIAVSAANPRANHAPVAVIAYTSDNVATVYATARGSDDKDGNTLSYAWDLVSEKGTNSGPVLQKRETTGPLTVYSSRKPGENLLTLTVFDGELGDTLQVPINSKLCSLVKSEPKSEPKADFRLTYDSSTIKLDASKSQFGENYTWDFGDGSPTASGMFTTHSYQQAGTYIVSLTVTSNSKTSTKNLTVIVKADKTIAEQVSACFNLMENRQYGTLSLDASCSSAWNGGSLTYDWDLGDGGVHRTGPYQSFSSFALQPRLMTLTVKNSDGLTSSVSKTYGPYEGRIFISLCTRVPTEIIGNRLLPKNVFAMADCSKTSPDNGSVYAKWIFSDGTVEFGPYTLHEFKKTGDYSISLVVNAMNPKVEPYGKTFSFHAVVEDTPTKTSHCEFKINNEWSSGYTGSVRVYNDSKEPISGWDVNLGYTTNRISNAWNTSLTGANPYTAKNAGWNSNISPSSYVEFGFQVDKNGGAAETPVLSGTSCQ